MKQPRVRWGRDGIAIVDGCICSRWGAPVNEMRRRKYTAQLRGAEQWLATWGPTAPSGTVAGVIARAEEAKRMLKELSEENTE